MNPWQLPRQARLGDQTFRLNADFRDILEMLQYLQDETQPAYFRWQTVLALFYEPLPPAHLQKQAMDYFLQFLQGGSTQEASAGPALLDWQQDAPLIIADINKAAGQEIRAMPFVHWWTFLSWFHAIGQGQLSAVVSIRDKLARGKRLEGWEQEYYRQNRQRIRLQKPRSPEEDAQKERLERLLSAASQSKEGR